MNLILRITKEPDERKQEILNAAVELFTLKGYNKTTITDIAKRINISQGLFYHYFLSKEEVFDASLEKYADYFVTSYIVSLKDSSMSLQDKILYTPTYYDLEQKDDIYYQFYNRKENKQFHLLLTLKVCEKMYPFLRDMLKQAVESGDINIDNPDVTASFLLYGQLGISLDDNRSEKEKSDQIRSFLLSFLRSIQISK